MERFKIGQAEKKISSQQQKFDFLWLLATQPNKAFSSKDILDQIMASGLMIHEKQFIKILVQNVCRKTSVPIVQKTEKENFRFKNKFMNNDFDYL